MNTKRSEKKSSDFLKQGNNLKRKIQRIERTFAFSPEALFKQFCPSRELDWIDGWECDLVFTSTGYMEKDCIFTTSETNVLGPGLWIVSRYEPPRKLELVRIIGEAMVIHFRINLIDNKDGSSTGVWNLTISALNEMGNAMIESMPDDNPQITRAIDGLEYYLQTGELLKD